MKKLVIVGGGSSGWMAAAMLSKTLGNQVQITVIESTSIASVGVGEASIPPLTSFNQALGLNQQAFMTATKASIKLGIQFEGWNTPTDNYIHAFGDIGRPLGLMGFHHAWLKQQQSSSTFWDYSFNAMAAKAGRFGFSHTNSATNTSNPIADLTHAYHFDAIEYANVLKQFCLKQGVKHLIATVNKVELCKNNTNIQRLILDSQQIIDGDIFIDCSGFKSLLLSEALNTEFIDWSDLLPCDRAWAVPCENDANTSISPYTRSIAHKGGWQWQIPLQHRSGNGMVFSSRFWSEEQALECLLANLPGKSLAEPKLIRFKTGRRAKQWQGNCIALGLASGFLEPLESTSIHLVQSGILRLIKLFPQSNDFAALRQEFNRQSAREFEQIRDFLVLHYHLNRREEPLWQYCQKMPIPPELQRRIDLFKACGHVEREQHELFAEPAWLQVMLGQGIQPTLHHPIANGINLNDLNRYLLDLQQLINARVVQLPTHQQFLAQYCPANSH
nr:tryptophan halogenase family protein [Shewanella sp. 1CM18E]